MVLVGLDVYYISSFGLELSGGGDILDFPINWVLYIYLLAYHNIVFDGQKKIDIPTTATA